METFIQARNVTVLSQGYPVLRDLGLTIPLGRTTFIIGPSGCGKSTLVKTMAGLEHPDSGRVEVLGKDYREMAPLENKIFRKSAGFIFQDGALWANQTVYNNLYIPLLHHDPDLSAPRAKLKIQAALSEVGYLQDTGIRPASLSSGERKLVGFARALVLDPQVLFMDEPTSFLDEAGERRINRILHRLSTEGKTLIAVGNMYELAFRIADYLCIMNEGNIYAMDTVLNITGAWPSFLEPLGDQHQRLLANRRAHGGGKW